MCVYKIKTLTGVLHVRDLQHESDVVSNVGGALHMYGQLTAALALDFSPQRRFDSFLDKAPLFQLRAQLAKGV